MRNGKSVVLKKISVSGKTWTMMKQQIFIPVMQETPPLLNLSSAKAPSVFPIQMTEVR